MSELAEKLKSMFAKFFDQNKANVIPRENIQTVLRELDPSWTQEELDMLFEVADKDKNGVIDYNEFIDFVFFLEEDNGKTEATKAISEEAAIKEITEDAALADSYLEFMAPDAADYLNSDEFSDRCKEMFVHHDTNGNGELDGEELAAAVEESLPLDQLKQMKNQRAIRKLTHGNVSKLILAFDKNKDGKIQVDEFADFARFAFLKVISWQKEEDG